jgi:hypothetical protein
VIPSEHFNTVLYTGNQGANLSITGVGFEPSLVWGKNRSGASNHWLFDAVRGTTKMLQSDQTSTEETQSGVTAFNSDGFALGTWIGSTKTNDSYVAWNWKANGAGGTGHTQGTISSTASVNADAGFSIVSYTGTGVDDATVGHGLSKAPEMVIIKNRIDALHWFVHHQYHGATPEYRYRLLLNTGARTYDTGWLEANPTATVFQVGTSGYTNGTSDGMIAYCFHSVDGYSKVGSYTGNSSTDGTFVHCGFRPAFIIIKVVTTSDNWYMHDTEREPYNVANTIIKIDDSIAESTGAGYAIDILSNGFKARGTDVSHNAAQTYVFYAIAESPFKHTNAR